MMKTKFFPDWGELVRYLSDKPQPQILTEKEQFKVVIAGLVPGQIIPPHPEGLAVYHFLEGRGWMSVDEERLPVSAGVTIITDEGCSRGVQAETKLAFLATRLTTLKE
jgi:quercetin dioxygenase-like cupin family protein